MTDFSNELKDTDHNVSNVTQALRLWQQCGLSEQQYVELMYEAKSRTRLYQGKHSARGLGNKIAYYFTVLRDLCLPDSATGE